MESATFDRGEVALEVSLRARKATNEAAQKLADAGALLGFRERPSGGLLGTVQAELQQAQAVVTQQVNRAPTIRNEQRRLEITDRRRAESCYTRPHEPAMTLS